MPETLQSLWNQGERFAAQKQWEAALACFHQIVQQQPGHAPALLQLSYLNSLRGHYREARAMALRAHAARPTRPEAIAELIARLRTFNETAAIRECIDRLPELSQVSIPLLLAFASQLSTLNQQEDALRFLDEAKRADPEYPATLSARAQVLTYLGRFDEAERDLDRCIRRAPELAQPHWLLARLRCWTADRNHVARLRMQLARPGRKADDVALLAYALHKELDDLGQHGPAWEALELACRAKRSRLDYRISESRDLIERLIAMPDLPAAGRDPAESLTPIFVIGMHRSGTTLLEHLLAGHSQVSDMGELYDFTGRMREATDHHCRGVLDATIVARAPGVDFRALGRIYLDGVRWRVGTSAYCVDKLPSNFLNLGFILSALPNARVLHMMRDPLETGFSNLRELFSEACPYSYDQGEFAEYFALYRLLMTHWHQRFPGRILDIHYDRLVADTEPQVRRIADYCGMPFEPAMLDLASQRRAVATASAVQVRGQVERRSTPKWKPYERQLQPLLQALAARGVPVGLDAVEGVA